MRQRAMCDPLADGGVAGCHLDPVRLMSGSGDQTDRKDNLPHCHLSICHPAADALLE